MQGFFLLDYRNPKELGNSLPQINVIGSDEFLDGSQILLVEHFLEETALNGLVVFG
jgi:hypothetical protein